MTRPDLDAIEASRRRVPTLHAVSADAADWSTDWPGYERSGEDPHASTLSPAPNLHGWTNDSGQRGYGLPHPVAKALARMPADIDALVARVRELEAALAEALEGDGGLEEYEFSSVDGDEFNNDCTIALVKRLHAVLGPKETL